MRRHPRELIFCESALEAEHLLAEGSVHARVVVPLAPAAAARLIAAGVDYPRIEDFYSDEELCAGAADRFAALARWADDVDRSLQDVVPEFRDASFPPARLYFFFLAWLANAVFIRSHALTRLADALVPSTMSWFEAPALGDDVDVDLGYFSSRVSLWKLCLPHWTRDHEIAVAPRPGLADSRVSDAVDRRIGPPPRGLGRHRAIIRREGVRGYGRRVTATLSAPLMRPLRRTPSLRGSVVLLQDGHDVGALAPVLRRRLPCVRWTDAPVEPDRSVLDVATRLRAAWGAVTTMADVRDAFRVDGADFWPVVEGRMRRFWEDIVPAMWGHYRAAHRLMSAQRPAIVVASYAEAPWQAPTLEAARALGIPTAIYQHGGMLGVCELPVFRDTDRRVADHMLVYGDGVKAYLDDDDARHATPRATSIVVGSARLDALRRRAPSAARRFARSVPRLRRPVVLYIAEQLRGNAHYLNCNGYPDVSFHELQARFIALFREFPAIRFLYKVFADHVPNPIPDAAAGAPNIEMVGLLERRVTTLMWDADLIVLDMPSTALLECLLTPNPIVVFADARSLRMREEAKRLLRRRCTLAETPDAFLAEVRRMLEARAFAPLARPDDAFLRAYGTHLNDGRAAERAADAICRLAGR